jgi:hypothetical protein
MTIMFRENSIATFPLVSRENRPIRFSCSSISNAPQTPTDPFNRQLKFFEFVQRRGTIKNKFDGFCSQSIYQADLQPARPGVVAGCGVQVTAAQARYQSGRSTSK